MIFARRIYTVLFEEKKTTPYAVIISFPFLCIPTQTCAALRSPSPATKMPTASAPNRTTPAHARPASQETDKTAQVLTSQHFSMDDSTLLYNVFTTQPSLSVL